MSLSNPAAKLIVTGFGPFEDHDYNPSTDAAKALAETRDTEVRLLPVTYTTAAQFARAHLQSLRRPTLFVHLGLGATRHHICFERCARNHRDGRPDQLERRHKSRLPDTQPIVDEPRDKRSTGLDVASFVQSFNHRCPDDLPPARVSDDCGSYVCNALYYQTLRACERHVTHRADALFIHIPSLPPPRARRLGRMLASLLIPASLPFP